MTPILSIVQLLLMILALIIIVQAVMSWLIAFNVINTYNETTRAFYRTLNRITDPIYRPIRRVLPDFGNLDLSPLVALLLIQVISNWVIPAIARSTGG
ncbi:YggT family protein [Sphingomonas bacterium]|uniref:YggT family protein n=1 Tax=Sphingomonas bacterium TaxID=1895847 RepID=UPI00262436FB|nr:YggT family protein [Sphingomonas bacterium]MDB5677432.1 osmotic-shock protein [Sphingomonas bacterium]